MADYSPALQGRLLAVGATHAELAMRDDIPTLGMLASAYGEETPVEWLVIQLGGISDFAEVKNKITSGQVYELADMVLSAYYYLNAAEVLFFIGRFKMGCYGTFYGAIDPMKITSALMQYAVERRQDIERQEREQDRLRRERESQERAEGRVSYEEYMELKRRAAAGDEDAARRLAQPNVG